MEEFKSIVGYEGYYEIGNYGSIIGLERRANHWRGGLRNVKSKTINPSINKEGYKHVILQKNGKKKTFLIHRLICLHFKENINNYLKVNHKDGNKLNNHIDNLEWCTTLQNNIHAFKNGLNKGPQGEKQWISKLTETQVLEIRKSSLKQKELAIIYNVTSGAISLIKRRINWKHI